VAARDFLCASGFVEIQAPIIGPVTDPGVRGAKQVDVDYYGHTYKLMTSAILYKQASLLAFDKVFTVAPNVRLEPLETASTGRHLTEFRQLDVEVAGATREEVMSLLEELVAYAIGRVVDAAGSDLEVLERDPAVFESLLGGPFDRVSHAAAMARLDALGFGENPQAEISWRGEEILSLDASRPFFVTDYPRGSRGFYDRERPDDPGVLNNFDLIAPEGFGELSSGSEREFEYAAIVTRMRETGENPAKYGWYLDIVRDGIPASAGFGVGVERLTRYVTGRDTVLETAAFPKVAGVLSP
jgi:asparaginyl-tRNA synthetase